MPTTNTIRRWCKALADETGCEISTERSRIGATVQTTIWIEPPNDVYHGDEGGRDDPLNGKPAFTTWEKVWEALNEIRVDMHFWRYEISTKHTKAVLKAATGEGRELLNAWVEEGTPTLGPILADWLADNGKLDLAKAVRAGIRKASPR